MRTTLLALLLVLVPLLGQAAEYQAGTHYRVLEQPIKSSRSDRVVVNEFFGYTCPHCNEFEPMLHHWAEAQPDDVAFMPIPVVFGRSWEPYAKAYYLGAQLGILAQTHPAMYNAVHIDGRRIGNRAALANFFADFGVSAADFDAAYDSFNLHNRLRQGGKIAARAKVTGVPSMLVNGKYLVDAGMAGGKAKMLEVVDFLVAQERP